MNEMALSSDAVIVTPPRELAVAVTWMVTTALDKVVMVMPAMAVIFPETIRLMLELEPAVIVTAPIELNEPVTSMMTVAF